jgi:hypothetical protein
MYLFSSQVSNWAKWNFYGVNFSGAVIKAGVSVEKRVNAIGRPSYYIHSAAHSARHAFLSKAKMQYGTIGL